MNTVNLRYIPAGHLHSKFSSGSSDSSEENEKSTSTLTDEGERKFLKVKPGVNNASTASRPYRERFRGDVLESQILNLSS